MSVVLNARRLQPLRKGWPDQLPPGHNGHR